MKVNELANFRRSSNHRTQTVNMDLDLLATNQKLRPVSVKMEESTGDFLQR